MNIDVRTLDASAMASYAERAKSLHSVSEFFLNLIPTTVFDAFTVDGKTDDEPYSFPPKPLDARGSVRQKRNYNVFLCCSYHYDHCDHYWHPLGAGIDEHRLTATLKSEALSEQLRVFYLLKTTQMKADRVSEVSLPQIVAARSRLNGAIARTPCAESAALSELTGAEIFCKQEHLQRTGSFKERGARNALAQLSPAQTRRGAIAASAGNHALGLARHGRLLSIPVTVVMPRFAPLVKVARCRQFGAEVVLFGDTFDECRAEADRIAEARGLAYVHPFDDPAVITGQGTLAFEILEQIPDCDAIVLPVGGGGLLAGIATVFHALKPSVELVGVEPTNAACFTAGLATGGPTRVSTKFTLADGLAVAEAGELTLKIMGQLEHRIVTIDEEWLALAMLRLAELEKCVIEGAGAAGLAALLAGRLPELKGRRVVLLLSGGNIDPLAHSRVIERGLAADGRIYRFDALISDRPGGLAHLAGVLAAAEANVTEIVHNRTFAGPDLSRVHVLCTVETRDRGHIAEVQKKLAENGVELVQETGVRNQDSGFRSSGVAGVQDGSIRGGNGYQHPIDC